jgi:hypothetical protein
MEDNGRISTLNLLKSLQIKIGESRRFEEREPSNPADIADVRTLFEDFVTDITVSSEFFFMVDSFALIHEAIALLTHLPDQQDFVLDAGEGLQMQGRRTEVAGEDFEIHILNFSHTLIRARLNTSQVVFVVGSLLAEVAHSVSRTGVDVYAMLEKFPVTLSKYT